MPTFTYTGEESEGKKVTETVQAEDRFGVYSIARDQGHTVSSIDESSKFSLNRLLNMEKTNYVLSRVTGD